MESEFDLGDLEAVLDLPFLDEGVGPPPEAAVPPERLPSVDPAGDLRMLTWALLGIVGGLGVLKLALFAVGGALAAGVLGAVFVAVHALLIAAGGSWFWRERYR